ncbi:RTA1 like protein-domain-containing protein [Mrakia frigida]|uniref:RTA1 domain-containing protein n=1 Tax=Mrakia frigida TaxID=29902 RepID=UPI003FCBFB23
MTTHFKAFSLPVLLALLALLPSTLAADADVPLNDDGTPKRNILGFIPSIPLAVITAGVYLVIALCLVARWFPYRLGMMWWLIGGCIAYAGGMALRVKIHDDPYTLGLYIASTLLVLLSPVFFILVDYMLFSRLVAAMEMERHLFIRARWVSKIFVISDCVTFFLQISGGGMGASESMAQLGTNISLVGIIAQLASFVIFIVLVLHFGWKIQRHEPAIWNSNGAGNTEWKRLYYALLWTCIGYLIRSVFRSIELSQGHDGYLHTHENWLYGLDSLPLAAAMVVFIPIYPGQYIGDRAIKNMGKGGSLPIAYSENIAFVDRRRGERY